MTLFGREVSSNEDEWVDRHGMKRMVPMELLVLGMPRTGTSSTVAALRILGYDDVYHMTSCIENPPDSDIWQEAIAAKWHGKGKPFGREEFDQVLGNCMAVTDWPCSAFAKELIEAYPEAKVVLTNRDPAAWYKSVESTIGQAIISKTLTVATYIDPGFIGRWIPMCRAMWSAFYGGATLDPTILQRRFVEHYEEVRTLVPKERLLEYKVGEGWDRLCEFTGKEIPDVDFPRVNETKEFGATMDKMVKGRFQNFFAKAAKVVAPVAVLSVAMYARSKAII
ncbi:hypothetical protein W97_08798 [Coniosporium apollinis CBS 100218]|uniref:NAD dependent epimerase/dehydratase n=1 Tax=Coniosporium apollinis (strain CBS 100218) TaxID=1168221 RepID=R7Z5Z9_CONA1|nr:uncharacterized protein W97_08798 [Coniosporium apollinis CBS 100218]EON69538.1 hypothetical protein W97_08798 [Coniosporium apollinis CBS 100218]